MPHVADARPEPGATDAFRRHPVAPWRRARRTSLALAVALAVALVAPGAGLAEEPASPAPDPTPSAIPTAAPSPPPTSAPSPEPSAAPADPSAPVEPSPDPGASANPAFTVPPDPTPTPLPPSGPAAVVMARYLYRSGAAVEQYTSVWCVPASVQTMTNLILGTRDRSYATQKLLASVTYRFNRYRYDGPGNDVRGWAGALNWRLPDSLPVIYRDRSYSTRSAALNAIVDSIEQTGYPVGVTVWHGGHAWAVVGYQVRQVPGDSSTREFLGFYVLGPLGSPRDPWPVKFLSASRFLANYNRYYEDEYREPWHNDYVLVRPEAASSWSRDWPRP